MAEDIFKYNHKEQWWNTGNVLKANDIQYENPAKGHYKIISSKNKTLMLYPKTKVLVRKKCKNSKQEIYHLSNTNDTVKLINNFLRY